MDSIKAFAEQLPEAVQKLQAVLTNLDSIEVHGKNNLEPMVVSMRYTAEVGMLLAQFLESYREEIQNAGKDISGKPNSDSV